MAQLMTSGDLRQTTPCKNKGPVKLVIEDSLEEEHGPFNNPLDEPSPLGLRLRKSPALLDFIQVRMIHAENKALFKVQQEAKNLKAAKTSGGTGVDSSDYTSQFMTNKIFRSREDLITWAREVGRSNGFDTVTLRSDNAKKGNKTPRFTLGCRRSGKYDRRTPKKDIQDEHRRRSSGTKKCDCPFRLKGKKLAGVDEWELTVVNGVHNHPAGYNASQHLNKTESGRFGTQPFMSKLLEHNYIERHRNSSKRNCVSDFFLTHQTSLDLLSAFPRVLKVVCLRITADEGAVLHIFGLASTNELFFVGLVFLSSNQKDGYEWAFRTLNGLIVDNGNGMPGVIEAVTHEVALIEAIKVVFATAKLLLHLGTIASSVESNCQDMFDNGDESELFLSNFTILGSSSTTAKFEQQLLQLRNEFSRYPRALEYVTDTWWSPYKESFVSAWTDKFMHFGIKDTSWESVPAVSIIRSKFIVSTVPVKEKILQLEELFKDIHIELKLEITKIKASLEMCATVNPNDFRFLELNELCGVISTTALILVKDEIMRANEIGNGSVCNCVIRCTHGLPCAHEIANYKRDGRPIPLDCIDSYWRKLDLEPSKTAESDVDERMKRRRLSKIETSTPAPPLCEPVGSPECISSPGAAAIVHLKQEKQPNEKVYHIPLKFVGVCPAVLRPYILDIQDVPSDGHCGFIAIASLLGNSDKDGWAKVRMDLIKELEFNSTQYTQLFKSKKRVEELHHALAYFESTCLDRKEYWMSIPDMGHMIASCYNVVLMHLSCDQCLTFVPLRTLPLSLSPPREIAIGFVNEHFVQVFFKKGHPMPPLARDGENYHVYGKRFIKEWSDPYATRIENFKALQPEVFSENSAIMID